MEVWNGRYVFLNEIYLKGKFESAVKWKLGIAEMYCGTEYSLREYIQIEVLNR